MNAFTRGINRVKESERLTLLTIYLVTFLLHFSVSFWVQSIYLSGDGFGVAAIAAFLTGENWSDQVSMLGYYGYGQAILYTPIFLLTHHAALRYILMGVVNSLALASISLMTYDILKSVPSLNRRERYIFAFLSGITPSFLIYTKWIWNETAMCVLPWVVLMLLVRLSDGRGNLRLESALLGFVAVYCYGSHGRGILFMLLALLMVAYIRLICKSTNVHLPAFAASFLLALLANHFFTQYLQENLWLKQPGQNLGNTLGRALPRMMNMNGVQILVSLRVAAGQMMASIFSTYGLAIVFFLFIAQRLHSGWKAKKIRADKTLEVIWIYSICSFVGAWLISIITLKNARGDYIIYTRYWSNAIGFVTLPALIALYKRRLSKKALIASAILFACWLPLYFFIRPSVGFARPFVFMNLVPYMPQNNAQGLFAAGFLTWGIFAAFLFLSTRPRFRRVFILFAVCVFLEAFYYCGMKQIIPETSYSRNLVEEASETMNVFQSLEQDGDISIYFYDTLKSKGVAFSTLQFMLPELSVVLPEKSPSLDNNAEDFSYLFQPDASLIYSSEDLKFDYSAEGFYRVEDPDLSGDNYIWIYGDALKARYENASGDKAENHYGQRNELSLSSFATLVGVVDSQGCIVSTGKPGYLMFGPYMSLFSGQYEVTVKGELLSGSLNAESAFDVNSHIGVIAQTQNLSRYLKGNQLEITVPFTAREALSGCEFRVVVNSDAILKITGAELRYLGAPPTPDDVIGGTPVALSLVQFFSLPGTRESEWNDRSVRSSGKAGWFLYGPYINLKAGTYQFSLKGKLHSGEFNNDSIFDICAAENPALLKKVNLSRFLNGDDFILSLPFEAESDLTGVEFRLYLNEGVSLELTEVSLFREALN